MCNVSDFKIGFVKAFGKCKGRIREKSGNFKVEAE